MWYFTAILTGYWVNSTVYSYQIYSCTFWHWRLLSAELSDRGFAKVFVVFLRIHFENNNVGTARIANWKSISVDYSSICDARNTKERNKAIRRTWVLPHILVIYFFTCKVSCCIHVYFETESLFKVPIARVFNKRVGYF